MVAMSGGVDSSVAAALLAEAGHEVIGVTMQVWPDEGAARQDRHGGCCGLGAVSDARAVAAVLGVPHYVFNMREVFQRHVIDAFTDAYARGRTPNPCVSCNEHVKFRALWEKADDLDADFLATGHYARLGQRGGDPVLRRAADPRKDQSYVLYPLRREILPRLLFPVGEQTKEETRAHARRLGLPVADKPDSVDICFVGEEGYAAVVERQRPEAFRPGPILDLDGQVLGTHRGLPAYTVGQRRGLGLATGEPRFVVALDPERNAVIVGGAGDVFATGCRAVDANWLITPPASELHVTAKVRSSGGEVPAVIRAEPAGGVEVAFQEPARAVTPGQAIVFYDGDDVVGGAVIDRVKRAAPVG
jgi:tRNA-specific 2-thiouridylase